MKLLVSVVSGVEARRALAGGADIIDVKDPHEGALGAPSPIYAHLPLLHGPDGKKLKLLRRIPIDPFTHTAEWGLRSDQDDPKSFSWGGQNVFDVYSKTTQKDSSGHPYSEY